MIKQTSLKFKTYFSKDTIKKNKMAIHKLGENITHKSDKDINNAYNSIITK